MRRVEFIVLCAMVLFSAIGQAKAQSLRVSPVTIELPVSAKTSLLTVGNDSTTPLTVQVRVLRWSQKNGEDVLDKTVEVAASPPLFKVSQGADGVVRIVRTSEAPVAGEEAYRILLDEVPNREKTQVNGVAMVIRQSIPVFFSGTDLRPGALNWQASRRGANLVIKASNTGQKHLKITQLRIDDGEARQLGSVEGLAGYVLGGQEKIWQFPMPKAGPTTGATLRIQAKTQAGPIQASAVLQK